MGSDEFLLSPEQEQVLAIVRLARDEMDQKALQKRTPPSMMLGTNKETFEPIRIPSDDLYQGTYIVGVTGSGKTSLMASLALQRIESGESVIVLDPTSKGGMIHSIIARLPESALERTYYLTVIEKKELYNKHPFSLNLFSYPAPGSVGVVAKQAARKQITQAFLKFFPSTEDGVYFNEILRNLVPILLDHPTFTIYNIEDFLLDGPSKDTPKKVADKTYRSKILTTIDNPNVSRYWHFFNQERPQDQREVVKPFLRRLRELLDNEFIPYHIGQKKGELSINKAIEDKQILLIHLPLDHFAYAEAAKALGTLIIMQVYGATFGFDNSQNRQSFTLVVDEFAKWVYGSGEDFNNLLQYGRQYGIRQVYATQNTSQFDEEGLPKSLKDGLTGAKTVISLRTTLQDRVILAPLFVNLGTKPKHIYRNVLRHLEDATNPGFVKEFYWRVVRPMEMAAKESRPSSYDFGFGTVGYEPKRVHEILEELNELFYRAENEQSIDEERMKEVIRHYLLLNYFINPISARASYSTNPIDEQDWEIKDSIEHGYRQQDAQRQERARKSYRLTEVVDENMRRQTDDLFHKICTALIKEPLAEEEPEREVEAIANTLHQLPDREGFIKNGNSVATFRTAELPPPHPHDQVTAYWNTIIKQTKGKYCKKGREEINNDILFSFANSDDSQQQSSQPRNTFPQTITTYDNTGREVQLTAWNRRDLSAIKDYHELFGQHAPRIGPEGRRNLLPRWQRMAHLQARPEDVDDTEQHDRLDELDDTNDF